MRQHQWPHPPRCSCRHVGNGQQAGVQHLQGASEDARTRSGVLHNRQESWEENWHHRGQRRLVQVIRDE